MDSKLTRWINHKTVSLVALALLTVALLVASHMSKLENSDVLYIPEAPAAPVTADAAGGTMETTGDFFKDFRAQRETAREDELALLDSIIAREGAPQDSIREADSRRIELTRFYEQERGIEKLLIARGFEDAAAFIQDGSVSIFVRKEKLTESESDKILEVALRESGQDAGNIKIIPVA